MNNNNNNRRPIPGLIAGDRVLVKRHGQPAVEVAEITGTHMSCLPGVYTAWLDGREVVLSVTYETQTHLRSRAPEWALREVPEYAPFNHQHTRRTHHPNANRM